MKTLTTRPLRIEAVISPVGCDACRGWTPITICDDAGQCLRDETCPRCGRVVEIRECLVLAGVALADL
jgi:hypothetical protein